MNLKEVKGIGPRYLELLKKLDIHTVNDLINYYPFRYEVLSRTDITEADVPEKVILDGKVASMPMVSRLKRGLNKLNFRMEHEEGAVGITIFNRAFMKNNLNPGTNVIVIGKYDKKTNIISASDIKLGSLGNSIKIEPVYHLTRGLSNKVLHNMINSALLSCDTFTDDIPSYLIDKYDFYNKKTALSLVHNPSDQKRLDEALKRLKYEELFSFMLKIEYLRKQNKKKNTGLERAPFTEEMTSFINNLNFELTKDQKTSLDEIIKDMSDNTRMNRLLQGDVGSGKTIVAFLAMYYNFLNGYQSVLMAPTEILAQQHYNNLKELLKDFNIEIALLKGSMKKAEKDATLEDIKEGNAMMVIGTHALIEEGVSFKNLGLIITDEQHRFGVNQRSYLNKKGKNPDVLYMSATPIPRTFALTVYGDMDISTIKTMPKGREKVDTYRYGEDEIKDVLREMYTELEKGHQIYVVASLIEESEKMDELKDVNYLKEKLKLAFKDKYRIEVLHGKMAAGAKDLIMQEFKQGKIDILISTTVVEVGVDVPNASMMVIFNAERFGLSTLHQLRGRVGRSKIKSKCLLISSYDSPRLDIMCRENDGFKIAEEDLKLRGSGDIFGTKQSGDMNFQIADLKRDYDLLVEAKKDAAELLKNKEDVDTMNRILKSIIKA